MRLALVVLLAGCGRIDFDPLASVTPAPPVCIDGWCWEFPLQQGETMYAITRLGADDVWAAGGRGLVMHYDGTTWDRTYVGRTELHGIAALADDDVWITGYDGTASHFDGTSWTQTVLPTDPMLGFGPNAMWGDASDDVWIGSFSGLVAHYDGAGWTESKHGSSSNDFYALWGSARDDVWFVGDNVALHYDGAAFVAGAPTGVEAVTCGSARDDVWIADVNGLLFHYDGTTWSANVPAPDMYSYLACWGANRDEFWGSAFSAQLIHGTPSGVAEVPMSNFDSLWAFAGTPDDAWATGEGGRFYHYDGATWDPTFPTGTYELDDLAGTSATDLWAVGRSGAILHRTATGWSSVLSPTTSSLQAVWAITPTDAYAVGYQVVLQWDGDAWSQVLGDPNLAYHAVWASGPNDVWIAAHAGVPNTDQLLHFDGSMWSVVDPGMTGYVNALWGLGPGDVWISIASHILHLEQGMWVERLALPAIQFAVAFGGTSATDVWAVGPQWVYHWNGITWTQSPPFPGNTDLSDVWVRSPTEAYFTDTFRSLWRWDGSTFSEIPRPTANRLFAVWGDATHVWMAGGGGAILSQ